MDSGTLVILAAALTTTFLQVLWVVLPMVITHAFLVSLLEDEEDPPTRPPRDVDPV